MDWVTRDLRDDEHPRVELLIGDQIVLGYPWRGKEDGSPSSAKHLDETVRLRLGQMGFDDDAIDGAVRELRKLKK